MVDEKRYWLGVSAFPEIGPMRFGLLRKYFGSVKKIWEATGDDLRKIGLAEKTVRSFDHFRKTCDLAAYEKRLHEEHVAALILDDPYYPKLLKEINDAPFVLYVKGKKMDKPIDMEKTIAVVGSRKATAYGIDMTKKLVRDLVRAGVTIVSGMAYGIDAVAHETAIASGGKTIAVLGCGVDIIAPLANAHIYRKLAFEGFGAVISEMPLGMRPQKSLFVTRNRIISGVSRGVVVIEGERDSGTLITAKYAACQGRDVFAVPGPVTSPTSGASSILLKNGARLVENARDILGEL